MSDKLADEERLAPTSSSGNPLRDTLTVAETARRLGIGKNACYEAVRSGQIPAIRICKRIVVPRAALDRMLGVAGAPAPGAALAQRVSSAPSAVRASDLMPPTLPIDRLRAAADVLARQNHPDLRAVADGLRAYLSGQAVSLDAALGFKPGLGERRPCPIR